MSTTILLQPPWIFRPSYGFLSSLDSRPTFAKRQVVFSPLLGTFVLGTMIVISLQMLYVVECGTVFTFTGKCLVVESIQLICIILISRLSRYLHSPADVYSFLR